MLSTLKSMSMQKNQALRFASLLSSVIKGKQQRSYHDTESNKKILNDIPKGPKETPPQKPNSQTKKMIIAAGTSAALLGLGYVGYNAYKKNSKQKQYTSKIALNDTQQTSSGAKVEEQNKAKAQVSEGQLPKIVDKKDDIKTEVVAEQKDVKHPEIEEKEQKQATAEEEAKQIIVEAKEKEPLVKQEKSEEPIKEIKEEKKDVKHKIEQVASKPDIIIEPKQESQIKSKEEPNKEGETKKEEVKQPETDTNLEKIKKEETEKKQETKEIEVKQVEQKIIEQEKISEGEQKLLKEDVPKTETEQPKILKVESKETKPEEKQPEDKLKEKTAEGAPETTTKKIDESKENKTKTEEKKVETVLPPIKISEKERADLAASLESALNGLTNDLSSYLTKTNIQPIKVIANEVLISKPLDDVKQCSFPEEINKGKEKIVKHLKISEKISHENWKDIVTNKSHHSNRVITGNQLELDIGQL